MKRFLIRHWDDLRSSYWFLPSLMVLGAFFLSLTTIAIDRTYPEVIIEAIPWMYANQPTGAREVLSSIAGSMITVAGVTFSMTMVAIVYATSQFGPRLLNNFMEDRGNQLTLGTFIATFLYCLLVLRTVRSEGEEYGTFVPHLSVLCALLLAIASIAVLIFFIHHVPESIHAANVVARVGRKLSDRIDRIFPDQLGTATNGADHAYEEVRLPAGFLAQAVPIASKAAGYVRHLDADGLLRAAVRHDLLLRLAARPGSFVSEGEVLAYAWPASRADEAVRHEIAVAYELGRQRTHTQDVMLLVHELVETASRALSPGTNDPFTARNCIDWLESALLKLTGRDFPNSYRRDEAGQVRVIADTLTFEAFADAVFDQLRPYVSTDRNAALPMMEMMATLAGAVRRSRDGSVLLQHAAALREACEAAGLHERDLAALRERHEVLRRILEEGAVHRDLREAYSWLGGSA